MAKLPTGRRDKGLGGPAEIIGEVIEAGGNIASAGVTGAAQVLAASANAAGQAMSGALQGMMTKPDVIVNNFGIVGTAGKGRVAGTMAALPPINKPTPVAVNDNMSTGQLVMLVVKYLSSIDNTLKSQIKLERAAYAAEQATRREQTIEEPATTKLGLGFGAKLKNRVVNTAKDLALSSIKTLGKAILGIGALYTMGLDTTELDAFKQNIKDFSDKFGWLFSLAAGGMAGFFVGGLKGMGAGALASLVWSSGLLQRVLGSLGLASAEDLSQQDSSMGGGGGLSGGLAAGAIGYLGYRAAKAGFRLSTRSMNFVGNRFLSARAGLSIAKNTAGVINSGTTFRFAAEGGKRYGSTAKFFANPKWRNFLAWLAKKGRRRLVKKIETRIAIAIGMGAVAATGAGAIVGVLGILIDVLGSLYLAYEVYQLWKDFQADEESSRAGASDADIAKELGDATQTSAPSASGTPKVSTGIVTKSETGRPEEAQAFFESKGWTKEQAAGIVGNLFVESGLRTDAVGDGGRAYGIAQWHPDRQATFKREYGKDIRESTFQEQLEFVNWELNNSEKKAGNRLRGASSAQDAAAIVDESYERSAGIHREQRMANAAAISQGDYANLQGGGGGGGGSALSQAGELSMDVLSKAFKGLRSMSTADTTLANPMETSKPDYSKINKMYTEKLKSETEAIKGLTSDNQSQQGEVPQTPADVLKSLNHGSVDVINPNYQVSGQDILTKYLKYFGVLSNVGAAA